MSHKFEQDNVLHDGRLAHLRQAEPVHRNLPTTPDQFSAKAQAMVDKYTVRTETADKIRWSRPRPAATCTWSRGCGTSGRSSNWKRKTYRLHLTAMDYNHGFSLQPANINIQVVPGLSMW